jgi:GR25 family glycosyltransferase involved in LPS biosynthesis
MHKIYIGVLFLILYIISSFIYVNESFDNTSVDNTSVNDDAYIISLNDRLFNMAKTNLSKHLSVHMKKFNAIKGSSLTEFNPKMITIGAYRSILYNIKRRTHADLGSINAVGCALSHASLWKMIKPGKGMFIFESDAILKEDPIPYVDEFLKTDNPHILLFGSLGRPIPRTREKSKIKKVNYHFFGMHGYYITYEGAQLLLKYFYPIEQQVDSYISDMILIDNVNDSNVHFGINVYIINPGICYQYNINGTSIQTKPVKIQYRLK